MTTGLTDLVSRIIGGDREAEDELVHRYRRGMLVVINNIVRNPAEAEDLLQQMFITVLEKIREGKLQQPERLSGFIRGIATNLALSHSRRAENRLLTNLDNVPPPVDSGRDQFEQLLLKEEAEIVRQVLGELKMERDRQVIMRYYIKEEDKESICASLGLTGDHFNRVRFRALERFKQIYEEKRRGNKPGNKTPGER